MKYVTIGIFVLVITACAHDRARTEYRTTAESTSTASRSDTVSPAPAAGSPAATAQVKNTQDSAAPVNADLVKQGYRPAVRRGQLFYCRHEALTGTRFKSEVCLTEEQIADLQKQAKDALTAPRMSRGGTSQ